MKGSDPAFPYDVIATDSCGVERVQASYPGISLRDYFAAKALAGICADPEVCIAPHGSVADSTQKAAEIAYQLADAMLAERES